MVIVDDEIMRGFASRVCLTNVRMVWRQIVVPMRDRLRILGWPQRKRCDSSDPGHASKRCECGRLSEDGAHLPGDGIAD